MAIEKKHFLGGLDSDTEDRLLANGDYRFALNIRASKSDGANEGSVENSKGNSIVNITLPNGTNRVIGAFDNTKDNTVIYCVYNSLGNHSIYEFDASTSTITLLLQTPLLKFQSTAYIVDSFIIGGSYFFNDRVNPPRSLNIARAKTNGYPTPFLESYINVIVNAPGHAPDTEFASDSAIKTNNVRGKLFQFRYKYVYLDNEESAWSPISKVALPENESSYRPFVYYPTDINNYIAVEINLGGEYVKKIKIAAREGNTGDFFLAADLKKSELNLSTPLPNTVTYKFYNDEVYTVLDNDGNTGMRLYDNVPQLADAMSPIDGNKVAFAGITEGYDPVEVDMDITVNQTTSTQSPPPVIDHVLKNQAFDGFGTVVDGYHFLPQNPPRGRLINGTQYNLLAAQQQNYRPAPASSQLIGFNFPAVGSFIAGIGYFGSVFFPTFQAGAVRDRAVQLENTLTGATIGCGGSSVNEILITDPNPSVAGIRYVLNVKVQYYDIGNGDALKDRWFKVQYTTIAGDTSVTIANALKNQLVGLGTVTENLVDIKVDKSEVLTSGNWSFGLNSTIPAGQTLLRIYAEAYVPTQPNQDPAQPFPVALGGDTGALYLLSTSLDGYADWTLQNKKTLKSGAMHAVGLVYMDEPNRSGLTNLSEQKTFYVHFFTERNIPNGQNPNNTTLTLTINHLPPSWAKRYQVVYSGNQTVDYLPGTEGYKGFVQFQLRGVTTSTITGAKEATIQNLLDYNDSVPEDIDLGYSLTPGDRIRFITDPIVTATTQVTYLQTYQDVEIIKFDANTNTITFKDPGITVANDQLIEIYTPKKKVSELFYYEIGECYDIVGGFHRGNTANQTANTPAIIDLEDIGDVYLRYRVAPINTIVEDYAYSDYYSSDAWDKGRPNIVDTNITRTKRETTIRYSNNYIPDTNINGLSRFDDFDFEEYDQQYGNIERIYGEDKKLIVFQDLKVGSVRIGQTTLYDDEGAQVGSVKSQTKVLSNIVYYAGEYGIGSNPESFAVYGNSIYFADVKRGAVLRLGGDGITPISKYKMHNYFNDTFKEIIDANKLYKVFGAFDVRFDEYIISIQKEVVDIPLELPVSEDPVKLPDPRGGETTVDAPASTTLSPDLPLGSSIPGASAAERYNTESSVVELNDTLAFSEGKNRWVTYYSYIPDFMISNNINLISFKDGQLYIHNLNALYNNFYNVQYDTLVEFLSNIEPSAGKIYNHIFEESSHIFSIPLATNQFGQKTSLIDEDFDDQEGVWKAAFLMDENTPNVTNPLIEGDTIRGHSLSVLLQNKDTELVKLFSIGVGVELSETPTNR